ncbi:hypothetical protein PG994_008391 [Apiospora phragmitis]|uniref:Ribosome biogenesis protein Sqt1 n=1 Tax=Apiospora phragmitis TaxID=2905665 RepID=A0ABR1USY5_9PEZI
MSAPPPRDDEMDDSPELLDADEALEEIDDVEGDVAMESDDGEEPEEIHMVNDSIAYFDAHKDSVFTIAQHPTLPSLIATGGSEGDADDAPGIGYVFDTSGVSGRPNTELSPLFTLEGHTDSINAVAFTLPRGEFLVSAGLDGRLRAYQLAIDGHNKAKLNFVGEAQEVPEINWVAPCPYAATPNTVALGGSDGSVWVYTIDASDKSNPLQIVQTYFMHTAACTAGAWSPDGLLLATVSEDSSLCVWDVWGEAAAKGLTNDNGQTVVSLNGEDQRFEVEGGLYSVAIDPKSTLVAVGGAGGAIKIIGLPRLNNETAPQAQPQSSRQSKAKAKGGDAGSAQSGMILASLHTQGDGIETLSFSPTQSLLAAGSVDGSIAVYDMTKSFAVRRHLREAHEEFSVVKVDFAHGDGWILTSCGMDGVVRRWDLRIAGQNTSGLVKEWRGHRGDGEGGGVLGFVQGTGDRIVTAGDDGIVLVFEA